MFLVQYYDHFEKRERTDSFHSYEALRDWMESLGRRYWDDGKMMISSVMLYKHMGEVTVPSPTKSGKDGKLVFPCATLDGTEQSRADSRERHGPGWSVSGVS